jgi:hypothetical protein
MSRLRAAAAPAAAAGAVMTLPSACCWYLALLLLLLLLPLPAQEHSAVPDAEAGRFVFEDTVQANDATSSSITTTQQLGGLHCTLPQ